jgi:amino acid adenylation domain-containing protein
VPNLLMTPDGAEAVSADVTKKIADYSLVQLKALARQLGRKKGGSASLTAIPHRSAPRTTFPLSYGQERLWFLDQMMPGSPAYNWPFAFRFHMPIDASIWQRALNALAARHEILRTAYRVVDGSPVQYVSPAGPVPFDVIDLGALPPDEREVQAHRLIQDDARQGFNLATGPLLRFKLLRMADSDYIYFGTMHHSIVDAWSRKILIEETIALVMSLSTGRPAQLPDLPIQYGDYAAWERQRLQGEFRDRLNEYWKDRLQGMPSLELPTDHPRPMVQSLNGNSKSMLIPKSLTDALRGIGQSHGATLHMTLLAAFSVLLMRYSGQDDIAVAVPIANRNSVDAERLIGFLVNTLVMRTDLSGNPSFRELVQRVREVAVGAYAHQDLPFEKLVEEMQPKRDLSRNPLAQVTFQLEDIPTAADSAGPGPRSASTVTPLDVDAGVAVFDLDLHLFEDWDSHLLERPEGIRGTLTYNTDLFEEETIERMLGHLRRLLEGIVADPGQRIWELPLLSTEESQEQGNWNRTEAAYPREKTIAQLFEEQAAANPEATALVCEEESLCYAELNGRANQLAHYLRGLGVGPEVLVGIGVERSVDMVVGLLGILKAGGAYVPLDPGYPRERLSYMLTDAGVTVLLTQAKLAEQLPVTGAKVVYLDQEWEEISRNGVENTPAGTDPQNLAYVIYTSGSTGKPKGVQVSNVGVVNILNSIERSLGLSADDVLLAVTSLSFDIAALELYLPLLSGAKLVISSRSDTVDPARLIKALSTSKATVMQATPATWRSLIDAGWQGGPNFTILCGGEALPNALAQQLPIRGLAAWNLYGPTETTVWSALWRLDQGNGTVLIGRPIANTSIYIVDQQFRQVPIGVEGELCIGGEGVARGYLNRPELTAEKFVPDPFSHVAGARMYRTGDRARRLGDGNLEFRGRMDAQVKIRGYRVEPGEIEGVLTQHPAIHEAVVIAREDESGEKRLVGYVVVKGERGPTGSELRSYLKERLPEYMVPCGFVQLPALPLTPNGKVDRLHLPKPEGMADDTQRVVIAPRDVYELRLAQLWEEILNVHSIGVNDNFFDIGGHSLLAVRLVSRISALFNRVLPLAAVFQHPTVEQLASLLRQGAPSAEQSPVVVIQPHGARSPLFLVHPAGGNVMCYYELARQLGADRPVYGLQDPGFDHPAGPALSVEQMAERYLDAIRTTQSKGPYVLGGWSTGGPLAFEMAAQLARAGDEIAGVVLLDALTPIAHTEEVNRQQATTQAIASLSKRLGLYFGMKFNAEENAVQELGLVDREGYFLEELKKRSFVPSDTDVSFLRNFLRTSENNIRATWNYRPPLYAGNVSLIRAAETLPDLSDEEREQYSEPTLGWQQFSQQPIHVDYVPGNHMTMMTMPYVKLLADQVQQCLKTVEGV